MGFVEEEFIFDLEIELWLRFLKLEKQRKHWDRGLYEQSDRDLERHMLNTNWLKYSYVAKEVIMERFIEVRL